MRRGRGGLDERAAEWSCDEEDGTVIVGPEGAATHAAASDSANAPSVKSLSQLYEKIKVLKRGSQGVVYLARERRRQGTGDDEAVNTVLSPIKKDDVDDALVSSSAAASAGGGGGGGASSYVAIKRMFYDMREERSRGLPEAVLREIGLLSRLSSRRADTDTPQQQQHQRHHFEQHPLVAFRGVCSTRSGELCLVMEACAGDVMSFVQAIGQPPLRFVAHVVRGMLLAVRHMHSNGVVHRDLKPSQVLIRDDGSVALADLGSARLVMPAATNTGDPSERHQSPPLTPGSRRTTLPYRAPEILLGDRHYDGRAVDMWGVGVTMAELLRGRHLFTASTEMQTLTRILGFIGTPTEQSWPAFHDYPLLRAFNFTAQTASLRQEVLSWRPRDFECDVGGGQQQPALLSSSSLSAVAEATLDLLERLMAGNPAARPGVDECLAHPFFALVPGDAEAWVRWRDGDEMPSKKPVVSLGSLSLGLGDDDDDDG